MNVTKVTNFLMMAMLILLTVAVIYLNHKVNQNKNFNTMTDEEVVEEIVQYNN